MKPARFVLIICLACGLAVPTATSAGATPTNFRLTATGQAYPTGGAHVRLITTEWIEASVPHVGRAAVQLDFVWCSPVPCPPFGATTVSVRISAKRGTLVLSGPGSGNSSNFFEVGPWSVVDATGRFAGYTGSGTYTWMATPSAEPGYVTVTVTVEGHLRKS